MGGTSSKGTGVNSKNIGRIFLGIAFILISLQLFRQTMAPIKEMNFFPYLAAYLRQDFVTAFIVGVAFAIVMHSSVAVVLIIVTLVGIDALQMDTGISIILGANLGSAFIPVMLTRDLSADARRVPIANLLVRGTMAVLFLLAINLMSFDLFTYATSPSQSILNMHLIFNASLLIFVPFIGGFERLLRRLVPEQSVVPITKDTGDVSSLAFERHDSPKQSVASLRRELIRMSQLVEQMTKTILIAYSQDDKELIRAVQHRRDFVANALNAIRRYVASMLTESLSTAQKRAINDYAEYAISLDAAAEIIQRRLIAVVKTKWKNNIQFSPTGWNELQRIHEEVVSNMARAFDVLVSLEPDEARVLIEEKHHLTERQRQSRKAHIKRIRDNPEESLTSSDLHLETLGALKDVNSQISSIGYIVLHRNGTRPSHEFTTD